MAGRIWPQAGESGGHGLSTLETGYTGWQGGGVNWKLGIGGWGWDGWFVHEGHEVDAGGAGGKSQIDRFRM